MGVTRAVYTIMVAVIVMLAVPVSQLRIVTVNHECCCPDPDKCHCPTDKDAPSDTSMKACHSSTELIASAAAPMFVPQDYVDVPRPVTPIATAEIQLPKPHAPPMLDRPRGPS
jgi:hypothetical protein